MPFITRHNIPWLQGSYFQISGALRCLNYEDEDSVLRFQKAFEEDAKMKCHIQRKHMNDRLKGFGRKQSWPSQRHYPCIYRDWGTEFLGIFRVISERDEAALQSLRSLLPDWLFVVFLSPPDSTTVLHWLTNGHLLPNPFQFISPPTTDTVQSSYWQRPYSNPQKEFCRVYSLIIYLYSLFICRNISIYEVLRRRILTSIWNGLKRRFQRMKRTCLIIPYFVCWYVIQWILWCSSLQRVREIEFMTKIYHSFHSVNVRIILQYNLCSSA
jgi:hypothetical protein